MQFLNIIIGAILRYPYITQTLWYYPIKIPIYLLFLWMKFPSPPRPKQTASWRCLDPTVHGSSGAVDPWEAALGAPGAPDLPDSVPEISGFGWWSLGVTSIPVILVVKVIEGPSFTLLKVWILAPVLAKSSPGRIAMWRCYRAPFVSCCKISARPSPRPCRVLGAGMSQETMSRKITFHRARAKMTENESLGIWLWLNYGLKYVNSIEFPPGIQDGLLIFDPFFFPASHVWLPKGSWIVEGPSPLYNRSVVIHDMPDRPRYFSEKIHCCWVVHWGNGLDGYFSRIFFAVNDQWG